MNFENKIVNRLEDIKYLRKIEDNSEDTEKEYRMKYTSGEDLFHFWFNSHWICSFQDILDNETFFEPTHID